MPSPFKNKDLLIRSIRGFMKRHKIIFEEQKSRISSYFEMICYNDAVTYYKNEGLEVVPRNLKDKMFRYKIKASGHPDNFSYFEISDNFEIHHNLSVSSMIGGDLFYTPDVAVIRKGGVVKRKTPSYYNGNRDYSHCSAGSLLTFFEVKHMAPFPELIFNFTGLVLNFMPNCLKGPGGKPKSVHLAPTLVLSGNGNPHCRAIKDALESKYEMNILFGLFQKYSQIYSNTYRKKKISNKTVVCRKLQLMR